MPRTTPSETFSTRMVNAKGLWHKHGAMPPHSSQRADRRPPPALNAVKLDELALRYVGRFATSRARLVDYLGRKLRERGWDGEDAPDLTAIAERLAGFGYIDDAAFALAKARSLGGRGYGGRRVAQALHGAGISEEDGGGARLQVADDRVDAALKMARRRKIGPFAIAPLDPKQRAKAIAAMLRGGHDFALTRAIVDLPPGYRIDPISLADLR